MRREDSLLDDRAKTIRTVMHSNAVEDRESLCAIVDAINEGDVGKAKKLGEAALQHLTECMNRLPPETKETKSVRVLLASAILNIEITADHLTQEERRDIVDPGHSVDYLLKLQGRQPFPDPIRWAAALKYLCERFAIISDESLESMNQRETLTNALHEVGKIPKRLALIRQEAAARGHQRRPGRR